MDLDKSPSALRTCKNMIVDRYGGLVRRPGLQYISTVKSFSAISYVSYSGSGTLYGITEFGDLSDPPKKYRNLVSNYVAQMRKEAGNGSGSTLEPMQIGVYNRQTYNDAGAVIDTLAYYSERGNAGVDFSLLGSPPTGTPIWIGNGHLAAAGGAVELSHELFTNSGGTWDGNWWDTFTAGKVQKTHALSTMLSPSLEDAAYPKYAWMAPFIGSGTDPNKRTHVKIYAVAGTDVWTVYTFYSFTPPAIGTGPSNQLYVEFADGDNPVDASTGGAYITGHGGASGGSSYVYGKFVVPMDTSFRFRLTIVGETTEQIPNDFSASSQPISDAEMVAAGGRNWFYLPEATVGVEGDDTYEEYLILEDEPIDFLSASAASGVSVGTEEWAQTSAYTGGITAESHAQIDYTMLNVEASYTLTGLTPTYTYPVTLTYNERDIGGANMNSLQEVVNVVASTGIEVFTQTVIAQVGRERKLINATKGTGVAPVVITTLEAETIMWKAKVLLNGGTYNATDVSALDQLHVDLKAVNVSDLSSFRYLLPYCGQDMAAMVTPSVDVFSFGNPTNLNNNLVEGDFDPAIGVSAETWASDGAAKLLIMPFTLGQLDATNLTFDMGYIITGKPSSGITNYSCGMWASPTNYAFNLQWIESSGTWTWRCGINTVALVVAGQTESVGDVMVGTRRSATERRIYQNGISLGLSATSDPAANIDDYSPSVLGMNAQPLTPKYHPMATGYSIGASWFTVGTFAETTAKQLLVSTAIKAYCTTLGRI